jgi:hypothetical protein
MLAWTKWQKHIPVPPAVIISITCDAWSNFHTGCNFFQLLHGFSQLYVKWTLTAQP